MSEETRNERAAQAALEDLAYWQKWPTRDLSHAKADAVLMTLLREIGYADVADAFEKIEIHYYWFDDEYFDDEY